VDRIELDDDLKKIGLGFIDRGFECELKIE